MAYVPGYQHDIFVSYAHADDQPWISRLVDRLKVVLKQRLGIEPAIWNDRGALSVADDHRSEIPDRVRTSALFLLMASPSYIRSRFCIEQEYQVFLQTIENRRKRFFVEGFANQLFALRCAMVAVERNEHWELFPGASDIHFCDEAETFPAGSAEYEVGFRRLVGEVANLLGRMRNHSTAVFIYPPGPSRDPEVGAAQTALTAELSAQSYRILPDRMVNLPQQMHEASLVVFLLGPEYDENAKILTDLAAQQGDRPWVIWCPASLEDKAVPQQLGFCAELEQMESDNLTFLNRNVLPVSLKEEVLALLRPTTALPETQGKPRIYLVYNSRNGTDRKHASRIVFHFRNDFHFDLPEDAAGHVLRLSKSDGVLLVWGNADEAWCSQEFDGLLRTPRPRGAQGLCLFDPEENKASALEALRPRLADLDFHVAPLFGKFDPARLQPFFAPLLRRGLEGKP
jgi:hypothetical protein